MRAASLILSCIDDSQMCHFDESERSPYVIWEALRAANFANNTTSKSTLKWQLNNMVWEDKDNMDSYLARAKGYQSQLKQLGKGFDNDEFVEAICLGLPSKYNLTKQSLTALMASNQKTSLDTVVHLLTKEEVRQKKQ